jgi:hypothetical protein
MLSILTEVYIDNQIRQTVGQIDKEIFLYISDLVDSSRAE